MPLDTSYMREKIDKMRKDLIRFEGCNERAYRVYGQFVDDEDEQHIVALYEEFLGLKVRIISLSTHIETHIPDKIRKRYGKNR